MERERCRGHYLVVLEAKRRPLETSGMHPLESYFAAGLDRWPVRTVGLNDSMRLTK